MKVRKVLISIAMLAILLGISDITKVYATDVDKATDTEKVAEQETDSGQGTDQDNATAQEDTDETEEVQWTDMSKAKFSIKNADNDNQFKRHKLYIEGVTFNNKSIYCMLIANTKTRPNVSVDANIVSSKEVIGINIDTGVGESGTINDVLEKSGDIYIWIYERVLVNTDYRVKEVVSAKKIERPAQNVVGDRMQGYFFNDRTAIFLYETTKENQKNMKIKIKIGYVTDKEVLKAIKDGKSGCLNDLLTYAKSAKSIYTTTVPIGNSGTITDKFDLIGNEYYYVYMQLDDENGKYYPIEDVSLYQGFVSKGIGKNLSEFLDHDFKWDSLDGWDLSGEGETPSTNKPTTPTAPTNTTKPDDTTAPGKIPQTGVSPAIIIAGIILVGSGIVGYMKYAKYKDIK